MQSRILTFVTAMTLLAALAIPIGLAAQQHTRYKLVDLGTLGGPASAINGGTTSLDSRGIAVGAADTSVPNPANSNPWPGCAAFVRHAFEWQNGVVTDLGTLAGADNCSNAIWVNASGETAGNSETGEIDALTGVAEIRAVRWKDGRIMDLGTFGGNHSAAQGINDRGQIVGFALSAIPDPYSFFDLGILGSSGGTETRAFVWQNGHMQDLGTLGGPDAFAIFVNQRGQVAGQSYTNSTPNSSTGLPTQDPFLWENGRMLDLGTLGGTSGGPTGINNRGQVIGQSNLAGDQNGSDPFLWDHGKLIDLFTSTIGGNPISANALNDAGEIVGGGVFANRPFDAYLWRNGVATDLGAVVGDCFSEALAMNSRGQIVGGSFSCDGSTTRSFLWEKGSMVDLNTLIPPNSDLQLVEALTINDRGEIAGNGLPPGCNDLGTCGHAYVLIPAGEDDTESSTAVTQNDPAPVSQNAANLMQSRAAALEAMARIHAQMARRSFSLGAWQRK
jgi:probable HAF family extracellular repeat protein